EDFQRVYRRRDLPLHGDRERAYRRLQALLDGCPLLQAQVPNDRAREDKDRHEGDDDEEDQVVPERESQRNHHVDVEDAIGPPRLTCPISASHAPCTSYKHAVWGGRSSGEAATPRRPRPTPDRAIQAHGAMGCSAETPLEML